MCDPSLRHADLDQLHPTLRCREQTQPASISTAPALGRKNVNEWGQTQLLAKLCDLTGSERHLRTALALNPRDELAREALANLEAILLQHQSPLPAR